MSSHHFVKEGQEPALLVTGNSFNEELLYHLLEWSPILIVGNESLDKIISLGIKVDVVWHKAKVDELLLKKLESQQPYEIRFNVDVEQAIKSIIGHKNKLLHVLGWSDEEALQNIKAYGNERLVAFTEKSQWRKLANDYEKWLSKGAILQFHSSNEIRKIYIKEDGFFKYENSLGWIVEELMIN